MIINSKKENDVLTVFIDGRLDTNTAPELENFIENSLENISELTFDLTDMSYTSSAGLRVFLKAQKQMNKQGKMKLINVQDEVYDVLEVTGFTEILTIER